MIQRCIDRLRSSRAVDHQLWNVNPIAYHAVNLVVHAAVTAVLFFIAAEVLGSSVAAFAAASIFAVHPIHTEAVAGVVGRAELLATLFFLLAFRVLRRRTIATDTSGALLYLLGLFSKENAVTLPVVVVIDDWLHRHEPRASDHSRTTRRAGRYGALALALGIYLAFRQHAVSGNAQMWPGFVGVSTGDRILTASRVLME